VAHPFFIGMSAHYIRLLSDCAMATRFEKDQMIFRVGETANRFYLIESGKVVLESGEDAGSAPAIC
jgi:CRP/FNR family cyclic AMP-dependent transcriptional regulator